MRAISIKAKLWIGFSVLVTVVASVCAIGRVVATRAASTTKQMVEGEVVEVVAAKAAAAAMSRTEAVAASFFRKPDKEAAGRVPKELSKV